MNLGLTAITLCLCAITVAQRLKIQLLIAEIDSLHVAIEYRNKELQLQEEEQDNIDSSSLNTVSESTSVYEEWDMDYGQQKVE